MEQLLERARAYLDALEAERQMALALSKQKAQEAELIKARQEGFQAAIDMVGSEIAAGNAGTDRQPKEPVKRRARRSIREMILHELSFSSQAMTTAEIARAINYLRERTQRALQRMEADGQVLQNHDRWAVGKPPGKAA
jgi:CRP-like cAMP-binding protein